MIFQLKSIVCQKMLCCIFLCAIFTSILAGCSPKNQPVTYNGYYFNTVISLTFYNEDDAKLSEECFQLCKTYENMLSRTVEGSDIWNINHSNGMPVSISEETYTLLTEALYYCKFTNGKIDITIAPLMDAWNFTDDGKEQIPPTQEEIETLLSHVDYTQIELTENNTVTLKDPEASIDLGFIAKGYIADKLKEYLVSQGVTSALINLGGNVCAIGNKPDGSTYTIGIQEPFAPAGTTLTTVNLSDSSAVTSGTYERGFTYDNVYYHHILNTDTGYPANNALVSVTILCESSMQADALSTTCFVLGKEQALEYIKSLEDVECILIDSEGNIQYS